MKVAALIVGAATCEGLAGETHYGPPGSCLDDEVEISFSSGRSVCAPSCSGSEDCPVEGSSNPKPACLSHEGDDRCVLTCGLLAGKCPKDAKCTGIGSLRPGEGMCTYPDSGPTPPSPTPTPPAPTPPAPTPPAPTPPAPTPPAPSPSPMPGAEKHWAVIAAGSNTFKNYRHQADACHAYQIMKAKGVPEDHIILMSYDDVANDRSNPFKGKLFNKPDPSGPGVDVYAGCNIDYRGADVTPSTFQQVLLGTASGKKLESDEESYVHISFFDHGAPGLIAFPKGELHKQDLQDTLQQMSDKKMFKKLVFYMEACESGSMWEDVNITNVYALSAANPTESSWGTYCGGDAKVNGKKIGSCLGDLFSVNWMEDTDAQDTTKESLQTQWETVHKLTTKSDVMQWGDQSFIDDFVSEYVGGLTPEAKASSSNSARSAISVRQLELYTAQDNYVSAESSKERIAAGLELQRVLAEQLAVEIAYENFLAMVYPDEAKREAIKKVKAMPNNRDCEMSAHTAFVKHGMAHFNANSGFAMQYHQYVVNVCADETVVNMDIAAAAARACGAKTLVV